MSEGFPEAFAFGKPFFMGMNSPFSKKLESKHDHHT
nr:MAG TPA: hypothetical protein [Bacteriophage sp.]